MARSRNYVRGSDDPQARALDELADRPQRESSARPERRRSAAPPPDFPECPPDRTERLWRLVRLFIETGEAYGRTRVISPWLLGKELSAKINADRQVLGFIQANGHELADDILARMIKIYWKHYADSSMSRTQVVNEYLDDYWTDLFDQAKTEYATDYFQRLDAQGKLKTTPHLIYRDHPEHYSLLNDAEYQEALKQIRIGAKLAEQVGGVVDEPVESGNDDSQS